MALDRFAQFFISPLMDRSSIAKEREVMESEFQMAVQDNTLRCRQFILSLAKNDVPVNTFAWGNLITLRDNISEDELYDGVHEFRKRHYSANRMTLSIQARLPMDVLQKYVLECFSNVPSNDLPPDDFKLCTLMFDTPEFAKFYYLQPIKDGIQVHLSWVLPSLQHKYKSKPHYYVSWVLGYEGRGSLLAYLIKKVWALTLAVGYEDDENSLYTLFSVNIVLTEEGLNHLYEVCALSQILQSSTIRYSLFVIIGN
jgi:nardilysin